MLARADERFRQRKHIQILLLRGNRHACGDFAQKRHGHHRRRFRLFLAQHLNGARFHLVPVQKALFLKPLQMPVHRGGRFERNRLADFPHGRRIALLAHFLLDKGENFFLSVAARSSHNKILLPRQIMRSL